MALKPLPGDPATVANEGRKMTEAAERMRRAAVTLRQLADRNEYRSDAVDALRSNADDVATVITKAAVRYEGAGHALREYAPVLEAAQRQADVAIAKLGTADVGAARAAVHRAELDPWEQLTLSEEEKSQRDVELANAKAELAEQKRVEAEALALYADAEADVARAATAAAAKIQDANDRSDLNDSFWDNWQGFVDEYLNPALELLSKILDVISDILGVIALILAFIPGLQPLAALLGGISLALKAITLLITVLQALMGKKSWGDVLSKAIEVAIAVVLKGASKLRALKGALAGKALVNKKAIGAPFMLAKGTKEYGKAVKGVWKFAAEKGLKYGARINEGSWEAKYDIDFGKAAYDQEYRESLTPMDYIGEGMSTVLDPGGAAGDLLGDLGGGTLDHFTGGGTFGTSNLTTTDVAHPVTVDFGGVDPSRILADSFGSPSIDSQPVRVAVHSGGGGW